MNADQGTMLSPLVIPPTADTLTFTIPEGLNRLDWLSTVFLLDNKPMSRDYPFRLELTCGGGATFECRTLADIPLHDFRCSCGEHYLVRWETT